MAELLGAGVDPNLSNQIGQGPLMICAIWGNARTAKVLLEGGAEPDLQNQFGVTPLHYAAQHQKRDIIHLLLEHGASTNIRAGNGKAAYDMVAADDAQLRALLGGARDAPGVAQLRHAPVCLATLDARCSPCFAASHSRAAPAPCAALRGAA
eukprot:459969-Prymnesium_polylepis.1